MNSNEGQPADFARSFDQDVGTFFSDGQVYTDVKVLCIYWLKNDLKPEDEIKALRECFETKYRFSVVTLPLPEDGADAYLNKEISDLVKAHSNGGKSLVIVYYAGHCAQNEDKQAEWAAFENGGPTLQWHVTQQLLFPATADILLLLDCCYASLIMKGKKSKGRFELVAACGMNSKTVWPGKFSFSSLLTKELEKSAVDGVFADTLASRLREHRKIQETVVFHDFARNSTTSIKLKSNNSQNSGFVKKPSGYVLFKASLSGDTTALEMAEWLKTAAPKNVTAVSIEATVLDARRLRTTVGGVENLEEMFSQRSIFEKLSGPAKQEIMQAFRSLDTNFSNTSAMAKSGSYTDDIYTKQSALSSLARSVTKFIAAISTPLLTQLNAEEMNDASANELVKESGAHDSIILHEIYHGYRDPQKATERSLQNMEAKRADTSKYRFGKYVEADIVIEALTYDPDPNTSRPFEDTSAQVQKMVSLLCHPKAESFHVLPCLGYIHNNYHHTFEILFRTPPYCDTYANPLPLTRVLTDNKFVPLEDRYLLASKLACAVDHCHVVGWVHKGIRSENIVFLPMSVPHVPELGKTPDITRTFLAPLGSVDLSSPCLFGFEYMRMATDQTLLDADDCLLRNIYRHPERWGKPELRFEKYHDIYALGVVLTEIAFWQPMTKLLGLPSDEKLQQGYKSREAQENIRKRCNQRLPHQVGRRLHAVIMTCLDFKELTNSMDSYESQRYFQVHVLQELQK